jgi:hypothetical protein
MIEVVLVHDLGVARLGPLLLRVPVGQTAVEALHDATEGAVLGVRAA